MAATTEIRQYTGSGPTATAITNLRHAATDAANDTSNPIVKPTSGSNYGYLATVALACTTTPAGSISNVKLYSDGGNGLGTGVTLKGGSSSSYVQATGTSGVTGDLSSTYYTSGTDIFTFTSGSPMSVSGSLSNPSTGRISDYIRMQLAVASTVTAGTTPSETLTVRYDET